jgi:hypothetical protein
MWIMRGIQKDTEIGPSSVQGDKQEQFRGRTEKKNLVLLSLKCCFFGKGWKHHGNIIYCVVLAQHLNTAEISFCSRKAYCRNTFYSLELFQCRYITKHGKNGNIMSPGETLFTECTTPTLPNNQTRNCLHQCGGSWSALYLPSGSGSSCLNIGAKRQNFLWSAKFSETITHNW